MEENAKFKSVTKTKERRQFHNPTEVQSKKSTTNLFPPCSPSAYSPPAFGNHSPVKKVLCEANKIISLGVEKDFALLEKEKILKSSNETIDNLRKNIIHLQMEYEKLDQNYQREISCRSEIAKRMEATRGVAESAVHHADILSASVRQLENDKLKIVEFYELIYQGQQQVEENQSNLERIVKEKDDWFKSKFEIIKKAQEKTRFINSKTTVELNQKLSNVSDKLRLSSEENGELQLRVRELKGAVAEAEAALMKKRRLSDSQRGIITKFRFAIKRLKNKKFKCQRLWNNKMKKILNLKQNNTILMKNYEKIELLHRDCASTMENLQSQNEELKTNLRAQLELESEKLLEWEFQKKELIKTISDTQSENDELKKEAADLQENLLELTKLRNDLLKVSEENEGLKEIERRLREESEQKDKFASELEGRLKALDLQVAFFNEDSEKLGGLVKALESQLGDLRSALSLERREKEVLMAELNNKLNDTHRASSDKINDMERQLEEKIIEINNLDDNLKEKTSKISQLEAELFESRGERKKALEKLENEISNNEQLNNSLKNLEQKNRALSREIKEAHFRISHVEEKLSEEKSSCENFKISKEKLEKQAADLREEIEKERECREVLKKNQRKMEIELREIQKTAEENSELKSKIGDLKNILQESEAKVEAYKKVVKKLESEKAGAQSVQSEEIFKLNSEVTRLEEMVRKYKEMEICQRERSGKELPENRPEAENKTNFPTTPQRGPTTPLQNAKKLLPTPRKVFTSTPQSGFQNYTPTNKKRDPYEFDSDSSIEHLNADHVLKVFGNRKKKESNKKYKAIK